MEFTFSKLGELIAKLSPKDNATAKGKINDNSLKNELLLGYDFNDNPQKT